MSEEIEESCGGIRDKKRQNARLAQVRYLLEKKMLTIVVPIQVHERLTQYKKDNQLSYCKILEDVLEKNGY